MFLQTVNLQWCKDWQDALLTLLPNAVAGKLFDATSLCRLWTAGPVPKFRRAIGDYTTIAFTGYADVTLSNLTTIVNDGVDNEYLQQDCDFTASADVSPSVFALGYLLTNAGGTKLWAVEQFVTPVEFSLSGDQLSLDLVIEPKVVTNGVS